jgi:hypothetical protein
MGRLLFLACLITVPAYADEPAKKPAEPELRSELMKRVKEDQAARQAIVASSRNGQPVPKELQDKGEVIDKDNTKWLKNLVDKKGWPTFTMVGADGGNAAWLLVQHADLDREFQKKCLGRMKELLPKGEVSKSDFAYLTDRVLVAEGKKQLYGTQFFTVNGKLEPRPIEDEAKIDERRKEMGLSTLEEYRKQIESIYGPKKK